MKNVVIFCGLFKNNIEYTNYNPRIKKMNLERLLIDQL